MITTCTHCSARYRLDGDKVPHRVIRVRCPGCQGVFTLDGTIDRQQSLVDDVSSGFVTGFDHGPAKQDVAPSAAAPTPEPPPQPEIPTAPVEEPVRAPRETAAAEPPVQAAHVEKPQAPRKTGRRRRSKEEMLARALVSDILVYNREMRDSALAQGNLAEAMSTEIKKSWELYKEKVTPEVANSSDCFREALNEILAEGEKVF